MDRLKALLAYGIMDTAPERGFDDAVRLAKQICGTPVALVSLVDDRRQWFKAKAGTDIGETDLDRSVCRFVVAADEMIVIPDLTGDDRTRDNPLVCGEPHIRFYAGAPLRASSGHVLGALCVIDVAPRPDGLDDGQRSALTALAAQVMEAMELRRSLADRDRLLAERDAAAAALSASEHKWRHLFERLEEGFLLGRVVRDDEQRIVDWRYEEVNPAWGTLVGIDPRNVIGRTIRETLPTIEKEWIEDFAEVVQTGEPLHFRRQVGSLNRWYDGSAQAIGDDMFAVLFHEVTDQVGAGQRQQALLEVVAVSRDCRTVADMTSAVAEIVGRTLEVARASYGHVDAGTETVDLEPGWNVDEAIPVVGRYRFADFGRIRDELAGGEPLVIDDVATDLRTADDPGPMRALQIAALVNMPVRERGRTVALFAVHSRTPRIWTADELAFIRNVADRVEIGIARLRAETQQDVLNREIGHRLKNSLAMVQAIANQTLRKDTPPAALEGFTRRLQALGTAHEVLIGRNAVNADFATLIGQVLEGAGIADRYTASGPAVLMGARATLSTSLLLHELATNAMKYGALSADGVVTINWRIEAAEGAPELVLEWRESGGPPVAEPTRRGFGSMLLRLGLIGTGGSTIHYGSRGISAVFRAPLDQVEAA